MKKIIFFVFILVIIGCGSNNHIAEQNGSTLITGDIAAGFAKTITAADLKTHLYILASDEFEGRETGEPGQKKAADYLKNFYISKNIASPLGGDDYFQDIPTEHLKTTLKPSENVVAFIEGSENPDEIIIISAHFDHVGINGGNIYNGADDNGSGTVAVMKIAEAFKNAAENGSPPKRSILFLHVTGEEHGLLGSKFYVNFPIFPLENTVTNLNIDMVGRIDADHQNSPDFVYVIGADKLSTELNDISEKINTKFTQLELDYKYNSEEDPNRYYYRSDHYNFAKNNIPIIFYFNGTHEDYHRPSDTPDKINYEILAKRAQLVFYTAWEVVNRENRIVVDK
jgi:Zn-dependent M28 family amino/carboxypeptidase